jgi:hypothetical protein
MEPWIKQLSSDLFWDVAVESVDPVKNLRWLVERVVVRGRWEDWLLLRGHLTAESLRGVLPRLKVPAREINFLQLQLGTWDA